VASTYGNFSVYPPVPLDGWNKFHAIATLIN
jgi:hypothetical protein